MDDIINHHLLCVRRLLEDHELPPSRRFLDSFDLLRRGRTRRFLHEYSYKKKRIGKVTSTAACLHAIELTPWRVPFGLLAQAFNERNESRSDVRRGLFTGAGMRQHPHPSLPNRYCRIYPLEEVGHDDTTKKKGTKSFRG